MSKSSCDPNPFQVLRHVIKKDIGYVFEMAKFEKSGAQNVVMGRLSHHANRASQ